MNVQALKDEMLRLSPGVTFEDFPHYIIAARDGLRVSFSVAGTLEANEATVKMLAADLASMFDGERQAGIPNTCNKCETPEVRGPVLEVMKSSGGATCPRCGHFHAPEVAQ